MIRPIFLAAILALGACTAPQVSSTIAETQQACVTVSPVIEAAGVSGNPTARSLAGYANAVCGPLAAGNPPPTIDASTPTWLGVVAGMAKAALPYAVELL